MIERHTLRLVVQSYAGAKAAQEQEQPYPKETALIGEGLARPGADARLLGVHLYVRSAPRTNGR